MKTSIHLRRDFGTRAVVTVAACAGLMWAGMFETVAHAQVTTLPINKCLSAKIKCVGKYVATIAKCDAKAAAKTGVIDTACTAKAAAKLANGSGGCLDKAALSADCATPGSQAAMLQGAADTFIRDTLCALVPGNAGCAAPLPTPTSTSLQVSSSTPTQTPTLTSTRTPTSTPTSTPAACAAKPDGTTCDAGTDLAQTKICVAQSCVTCTAFVGMPRFVDNSDGTVTDRSTCLVWEQKTTTVGSGDNPTDPHDVDNVYSLSALGADLDGTAFTDFLSSLNAGGGFAGHKDWRLPSQEGRNRPFTGAKELEGILAAAYPCGASPCINAAFGPTQADYYWTGTTEAHNAEDALYVYFGDGLTGYFTKTANAYVRAVRGGM